MKFTLYFKILILCALIATGCNKDDNNNDDQGCVKEENFFEAEFDGETIEPYYVRGGGFGLYTLNFNRCPENQDDWLLTVRNENDISLYVLLSDINNVGSYNIVQGNPDLVPRELC